MGRLLCVCGNIISDIGGDDAYACKALEFEKDDIPWNEKQARGILECDECGVLAIEDPIDSNKVKFYIPHNKKHNRLFL